MKLPFLMLITFFFFVFFSSRDSTKTREDTISERFAWVSGVAAVLLTLTSLWRSKVRCDPFGVASDDTTGFKLLERFRNDALQRSAPLHVVWRHEPNSVQLRWRAAESEEIVHRVDAVFQEGA